MCSKNIQYNFYPQSIQYTINMIYLYRNFLSKSMEAVWCVIREFSAEW